ncbi:MAG: hypothetical protein GY811_21785 [Myxococcales bacterium]|nr:hypothetical protein [Myxococcales bacterium]
MTRVAPLLSLSLLSAFVIGCTDAQSYTPIRRLGDEGLEADVNKGVANLEEAIRSSLEAVTIDKEVLADRSCMTPDGQAAFDRLFPPRKWPRATRLAIRIKAASRVPWQRALQSDGTRATSSASPSSSVVVENRT